jgi:hypothetical protein
VKYALKGVQAAPSLADGDGHADLGHVGDGHLEELVRKSLKPLRFHGVSATA